MWISIVALLVGIVILWTKQAQLVHRSNELLDAYNNLENYHNDLVDKHNSLCQAVEEHSLKVEARFMLLYDKNKALVEILEELNYTGKE